MIGQRHRGTPGCVCAALVMLVAWFVAPTAQAQFSGGQRLATPPPASGPMRLAKPDNSADTAAPLTVAPGANASLRPPVPPVPANHRLPRVDEHANTGVNVAQRVAATLRTDLAAAIDQDRGPTDEFVHHGSSPNNVADPANLLPLGCIGGWSEEEAQSFRVATQGMKPSARQPTGHAGRHTIAAGSDAWHLFPKASASRPTTSAIAVATRATAKPSADDLLDDDLLGSDALSDDLLGDRKDANDTDPLSGLEPLSGDAGSGASSRGGKTTAGDDKPEPGIVDPHAELFLKDQYPSAQTCAQCHPKHYEEWRGSAHAYANISPMFQRFEQAMQELTRGTVGSFCVRCHSPVAIQLEVPRELSVLDAPTVVREGITCVACHRVNEAYGLTHGDRRVEPGDAFAPIYSPTDGRGVHHAAANAKELKLKLTPEQTGPGQPLHGHGFFEQLSKSDFCGTCHQVAVHPGIGLEIVYAQFRASPAHARGVTCQDCHMGAIPGKAEGYELDYCAIINEKPWGEQRKHANHSFWGPNYSIAHPGIFPQNKDANRYTPRQWLAFEYRNGWGTEEFEKQVAPDMAFPKPWDNKDDRIDGRKVIDANLAKLEEKRAIAAATLSAGGKVEGPFFKRPMQQTMRPLHFHYAVNNISDGHNFPTGSLGAQPQLWLNVALIGPDGRRLWETGYLDSNGDLADMNSYDVATHQLPRDAQLFNLQTKFLVNNVRGTDRETPVPVNFSIDPNPFLRPAPVPVSVLNHPPLIRMEAHSIPPLGQRVARYAIPGERLSVPGQYRLTVRLRSRPEPPYFMRLVRASPEMIRRLNENVIDFNISSHTFTVVP